MSKALRIGCFVAALSVPFSPLALTAASADQISCIRPDVAARVDRAAPVDVPPIAALQGASGEAIVQVDLDPTGAVIAASILTSTGNTWLDKAALATARESSFQPEIHDCVPLAGSYTFVVDFGA